MKLLLRVLPDNEFFWWFVGFVDSKGCFIVEGSGKTYYCRFIINLRKDDENILRTVKERLNIGKIYYPKLQNKRRPGAKEQCQWKVFKKSECLKLVKIFDEYQLRTKKVRDYKIWRQAVIFMNEKEKGNRWIGPLWSNWKTMEQFKEQIKKVRKYICVS